MQHTGPDPSEAVGDEKAHPVEYRAKGTKEHVNLRPITELRRSLRCHIIKTKVIESVLMGRYQNQMRRQLEGRGTGGAQ